MPCPSTSMRTNYPHHLPAFSYVGIYRYFLTFCTDQRAKRFTDSAVVELVTTQFVRAAGDERFAIIAACVMSDHVHLLVEGQDDDADLKKFIARAKQFSGFEFAKRDEGRLWQRYGYEHVLRDEENTRGVAAYILENPVRAGLAETVEDYPHFFSSLHTREELIEFVYGRYG